MAKLEPGDVVTSDCEAVDQLPPRALALAGDGTLAEVADGPGVMARGKLFLASRRDDYVAELSGNGLAVCEDSHPFAAAGAPLRLALSGAPAPVCTAAVELLYLSDVLLNDGAPLVVLRPFELTLAGRSPLGATYAGETWRLRRALIGDASVVVEELGSGTVGPDGQLSGLPATTTGYSVNFANPGEGPRYRLAEAIIWAEITCHGFAPPAYESGLQVLVGSGNVVAKFSLVPFDTPVTDQGLLGDPSDGGFGYPPGVFPTPGATYDGVTSARLWQHLDHLYLMPVLVFPDP